MECAVLYSKDGFRCVLSTNNASAGLDLVYFFPVSSCMYPVCRGRQHNPLYWLNVLSFSSKTSAHISCKLIAMYRAYLGVLLYFMRAVDDFVASVDESPLDPALLSWRS